MQRLLNSYRAIDVIDLEEYAMKMMGTYDLSENLSHLIKKIEKGRELARAREQMISYTMMLSKGINL